MLNKTPEYRPPNVLARTIDLSMPAELRTEFSRMHKSAPKNAHSTFLRQNS